MNYELIEKISESAQKAEADVIKWWEDFAKVVTEAEEYVKKHGKPLTDYLKEYGNFGPRDDAAMARLSGGVPKGTTLAPKDPGHSRNPNTIGAKKAGEREFSGERVGNVPEIDHEVMVKDTKGNMALYTVIGYQGSEVVLEPKMPKLRGADNLYKRIRKLQKDQGFVTHPDDETKHTVTIM